jgi:uncharacterized protein
VAILVDTSGLYAFIDADDRHHLDVRRYLEESSEALVVPVTVLPEIDYLVTSRLGVRVELAMLRTLASGEIQLEPLTPVDMRRCIELVETYADSDIGLVDASIVAIAERLRILQVLTLDQRHFRMIRPRHCPALDLLP